VALFGYRSMFELGARARPEFALAKTKSDLRQNDWYRVALGKGTLLLHSLRALLGDDKFVAAMDSFGRANAGKEVSAAQFQAHVEKAAGKKLGAFFKPWLEKTGLPELKSTIRILEWGKKGAEREFDVWLEGSVPGLAVPVTVESAGKVQTRSVALNGAPAVVTIGQKPPAGVKRVGRTEFLLRYKGPAPKRTSILTEKAPLRVTVDRHGWTVRKNGGPFSVLAFYSEVERALIVYGTGDELATNRESARALQQALRRRGANVTVPIKRDRDVRAADLKGHHLLLIGRPDSNSLVARLRAALPVEFGRRSFVVRGKVYAHADSAVLAAAENPHNKRYSVVVIAGLGAASTLRAAPMLGWHSLPAGEVVVLAHGKRPHGLVVPPKEFVREVKPNGKASRGRD
jgi:hypothetical protein